MLALSVLMALVLLAVSAALLFVGRLLMLVLFPVARSGVVGIGVAAGGSRSSRCSPWP